MVHHWKRCGVCVRYIHVYIFLRYDIISLRQLTNGANLLSSPPPNFSSNNYNVERSLAAFPFLVLFLRLPFLFYSLLFTRASMLKLHRFAAGGGFDGGGAGISQES